MIPLAWRFSHRVVRQIRARDHAHGALDVIGQQFELTGRQRKPPRVVDRPLTVDQDDDAVLAVEQLVNQLVNTRGVGPEPLSQRHGHVSAAPAGGVIGSGAYEPSGRSPVSGRVRRLDGRTSLPPVARERRNPSSSAAAP
jgi:hypothetical protein